jgi:hypothetical protein
MIGGKIQHTDILLDTNKKVGLEINNDNTKYMFMPCHQNAGKKVKVKLSLCLIKHHALKTYWGSGGTAPRILDFGTRWCEWSASSLGRFTPGKEPLVSIG